MLQKTLFDIKFTAKQLEREAKKSEKKSHEHKLQVKRAIEKGDRDRAQICAENALREKAQSLNLYRLATRMEAVAGRLNQAIIMNKTTKVRDVCRCLIKC
jgi:charged multivesicular body protein 1